MAFSSFYIITTVLVLSAGSADATRRCNAHNFVANGVVPCAFNWWMKSDLSRDVTFSPNLTSIISQSLNKFNVSVSVINDALSQMLNGSATLSRLVETGGILEPYVSFVIADAIKGFNLTNAELDKLGLSRQLSNITILQNLYLNYFSLSCRNPLQPLKTCLADWAKLNCDADSDGAEELLDALDHITTFYCEGNSTKPSVRTLLNGAVGSVFAPVAKYFGVYKDSASPYFFNLSSSSVFLRQDKMKQLGDRFMNNCGHIIMSLMQFENLTDENSAIGAGEVADLVMEFGEKIARCSMMTWNQFDPSFFGNHSVFMSHLKFMAASLGVEELSYLPGSFSKERQTAAVFGGNHIMTFNESKPVTCVASKGSLLLNNRFFTLSTISTPVPGGSYVSQVTIVFKRGTPAGVMYVTGKGPIATPLNVPANVTIEELPRGIVRITDRVSGAVFALTKYEESYLLFVRAGEEIIESSVGLLEEECLQPINIWSAIARAPSALRLRCQTGCAKAPRELVTNCVYDCIGVNDNKVALLYSRLAELRTLVGARDSVISSILN